MKVIFSEHNKDYATYTFDYAVYAIMEAFSELPEIYNRGFLPYSNDLTDNQEIFYLARSLRVDLENFKDSSENRRVNRKIEPLSISAEIIDKDSFNLEDENFRNLCMKYAEDRFSGNAMDSRRFHYVLNRQILSHIITFTQNDGGIIGYVFALIEGGTFHYWYSFFNHGLMDSVPIGKWMMWRSIHLAKEMGLKHVYLGTCYGEKALYKVRDFKSLSFFDGTSWNPDMKLLKEWCKSDARKMAMDRFKLK